MTGRRRTVGALASVAAAAVLVTGCTDEPGTAPGDVPSTTDGTAGAGPVVVADDAYPVINTFLLGLEAGDAAAITPLVEETDRVDDEIATYGGQAIDYFSVVVNFDEVSSGTADRGQFRARVGEPGRLITLRWRIAWSDGQWRVEIPPDRLTPGRIG